jgi:hypothetical protein
MIHIHDIDIAWHRVRRAESRLFKVMSTESTIATSTTTHLIYNHTHVLIAILQRIIEFFMDTETATDVKTIFNVNRMYNRERRAESRLIEVMSTDPTSATIQYRGHDTDLQDTSAGY